MRVVSLDCQQSFANEPYNMTAELLRDSELVVVPRGLLLVITLISLSASCIYRATKCRQHAVYRLLLQDNRGRGMRWENTSNGQIAPRYASADAGSIHADLCALWVPPELPPGQALTKRECKSPYWIVHPLRSQSLAAASRAVTYHDSCSRQLLTCPFCRILHLHQHSFERLLTSVLN
jgi:hypothetical protein